MKTFKSSHRMLQSLNTEEKCREYLEELRWHGEPICPHCGSISKRHYKLTQNGEFKGLYKCKDCRKRFTIYMGEINDIGGISLSLFLGIAMITLKLWQLADLALPLITLLAGQTILMFLFTYFVIFNIMGRDYDAAVLSSGVCGFGMGATPNAMANMQAICERYVPSVKAYLLVPLIGSLFADFLNSLVITFFINFL